MNTDLVLHVECDRGVHVVHIPGQLTIGNREQLRKAVLELFARGTRQFRLDFTRTAYVDSAALAALVTLSRKVRDAGGEMALTGLSDALRSLFEVTRLDTILDLRESMDARMQEA